MSLKYVRKDSEMKVSYKQYTIVVDRVAMGYTYTVKLGLVYQVKGKHVYITQAIALTEAMRAIDERSI